MFKGNNERQIEKAYKKWYLPLPIIVIPSSLPLLLQETLVGKKQSFHWKFLVAEKPVVAPPMASTSSPVSYRTSSIFNGIIIIDPP